MSVNIYQVFTRLFRNDLGRNVTNGDILQNGCSKFNHFDAKALKAIKLMGFTHIWFTGVIRHATTTPYPNDELKADCTQIVKGKAGSPYAIKDYFDVAPDLAENVDQRMNEFRAMVKRCHNMDLKVIIDFVPNHVCRQYASDKLPEGVPELGVDDNNDLSFSPMNNFYYLPGEHFQVPPEINGAENSNYVEYPAKATGKDIFRPNPAITDWYETIKLNYGVDIQNGENYHFNPTPNTWYRMHEVLLFWALQGIDGFRIDMADMIPIEFWNWVIPKIKESHPKITFTAEVYKPEQYRQFIENGLIDWLYDKEQFYNVLRNVTLGHQPASDITQIWQQQEGIEPHLLRFMENHDEERIASNFFAGDAFRAVPAMILAATMGKGPLMIYFGQEIGEPGNDAEGFSSTNGKTSIFDYWRIEKYQRWVDKGQFTEAKLSDQEKTLRNWYIELLQFRQKYSHVLSTNFYDLMWVNQHVDTSDIFAYLRYSDNDILLVIVNFNHENQSEVLLNLTSHVLSTLNLNPAKSILAKAVFGNHSNVTFKISENENLSAKFKLEPQSGIIMLLN